MLFDISEHMRLPVVSYNKFMGLDIFWITYQFIVIVLELGMMDLVLFYFLFLFYFILEFLFLFLYFWI